MGFTFLFHQTKIIDSEEILKIDISLTSGAFCCSINLKYCFGSQELRTLLKRKEVKSNKLGYL